MQTVLLVEDDAAVLKVLRQMLQRLGYTILEASGVAAAIEIAGQHLGSIDLLITDVVLPQTGSSRLVERLKAQRPHLAVLYISGYSSEMLARYGIADSEPNFLQKPFTAGVLTRKITEVLRRRPGRARTAGSSG